MMECQLAAEEKNYALTNSPSVFFKKNYVETSPGSFETSNLEKIILTCKRVEANNNFQLSITDQELIIKAQKDITQTAFVIQMPNKNLLTNFTNTGIIYQIRIAGLFSADDDYHPLTEWSVEDNMVFLIHFDGNISFHLKTSLAQGNVNTPLNEYEISPILIDFKNSLSTTVLTPKIHPIM